MHQVLLYSSLFIALLALFCSLYAGVDANFSLSDGTTTKNIITFDSTNSGDTDQLFFLYDFIVFLSAGDSLIGFTDTSDAILSGSTRQLADISGNLVNPI